MSPHPRLTLALLALLLARGAAAQPASQPATRPTQLTLRPSAVTKPVLKYRLLPDVVDLTPGNAAILYLMAASRSHMAAADNPQTQKELEALDEWLTGDPRKIDRERATQLLSQFSSALHQLELAARRERCDWDLPSRTEAFGTLLPYLQEMRSQARLLALQARLQIADGKFDEAAHTLQTGFAMVQHLNGDAFLVQSLVGTAIGNLLLDQVEFWIATPGSPNLYWPLTDLPTPLIDLHSAMRQERAGVYFGVPHLKEAGEGKLTGEQLTEMLSKLTALQSLMGDSSDQPKTDLARAVDFAAGRALLLPKAKAFLAANGYGPKAIDAMQPSEAIGLWWSLSYNVLAQDTSKIFAVPLSQSFALESPDAELARHRDPANPLMSLLPAVSRVRLTVARLERRIAELRSLELIRAYAAAHDGNAPATLSGIAEIPVPLDPLTGAPFPYRLEKNTALLDAPPPPGGQGRDGRRYEVKVAE